MLIAWLAGMALWVGGMGDKRSAASMPHLRPLDSLVANAIDVGLKRSPTFGALVQTIEGSEFVVYVESSRKLKDRMEGCLVHGAAGPRYLRVLLKTGLSVDERIEVLGHELQHVREVIQAGIPTDAASMQALFSRIGYNKRQERGRQQEYETEAARLISATVARELRATAFNEHRQQRRTER